MPENTAPWLAEWRWRHEALMNERRTRRVTVLVRRWILIAIFTGIWIEAIRWADAVFGH